MNLKVIAIHQPNFFPWLGYFDKINKADAFVYLDHVLMNPRTSSYIKKVSILVNSIEFNFVIPLKNKKEITFQPINEIEIDVKSKEIGKAKKTFELSYKRAPFFIEAYELMSVFFSDSSPLLSERNQKFIKTTCDKLEINKPMFLSSKLNCSYSSNELLIEIVKKLYGTCYMPGGGADEYQQDELFIKASVDLKYQNFDHPLYSQFNSTKFVKGLSILDVIANIGINATKELLQKSKNE
jgi:hypothetical protein